MKTACSHLKLTVFIFFVAFHSTGSVLARITENVNIERWIRTNFSNRQLPPFSFEYGEKSSDTFIKSWKYREEKLSVEGDNVVKYRYTYQDSQTGLKVECEVTGYPSFQAVEWLLKFSNTSQKNTPLLSKAKVIDRVFSSAKEGTFILHHNNGSTAQQKDFSPVDEKLIGGKEVYIAPKTGRSSEGGAFPFFNIEYPDNRGVVVSIGWTGNWYASVQQKSKKEVVLHTGMEEMNLILYPGEKIRTPLCGLMFWEGEDRMTGHNQFRKFILSHHSRKLNGKFAEYPISGGFNWGDPYPCNEYSCLTEDYACALINRYKRFGITPEVFWLDAGWYKGCSETGWGANVGNWNVDKDRFPNGLKPVSDAAHRIGAKFMVWFEPERVHEGTAIDKEHPQWLLRLPGNDNRLFNLGNPQARIWLTDLITNLMKENGIDYYRQDFNIHPVDFWKNNDQPNRIGMTEIRYVEGLYAFWDSILVRFPNALIDNCASGGNRLDLETVSRSAPLWRTDYGYGEPNGYQCHTYGLNFYLPLSGTGLYRTDPFSFRSSMGSAVVLNWKLTNNDMSIPEMQQCVADFKRLRPYYYGDYYPLTSPENITGDEVWLAYQMNRPDQKDGIIVAFRRKNNRETSIRVFLKGLDPGMNYELYNEDSKQKIIEKGRTLMAGFNINIQTNPGSLLITYKNVDN
ncbi:MAG: alpha-galactosidase [Bacteroidota bacterium]|nr:alpha-galactosidase [Bacteroidota bacterium]